MRRVGAIAAVLLASLANVAHAEPTAADRENARAYMADGRQKRDANDLKDALRAFEAADAIMHVPTTSFEVAKTRAMMGALIEARDELLRIARSAPIAGEPPPFAEARAASQKLADDLEARIPSVRVSVKNGATATISIDGETLPTIALGLPRKLDPGTHVVVAKSGSVERRVSVQVLEREAKEVPIDFAELQPLVTIEPEQHPAIVTTTTHKPPWLTVGIVGLATGAVGLAIGSVTGAMSLSQTSTIKSQCNGNACPPTLAGGQDTKAAISDAKTLALASDIAFIAGGVLAAVGATFVIIGVSHKSEHVALGVGPASFFLSGAF